MNNTIKETILNISNLININKRGGKSNQQKREYITYNDKKYVLRTGKKGGKYFLLGKDKKKIYV